MAIIKNSIMWSRIENEDEEIEKKVVEHIFFLSNLQPVCVRLIIAVVVLVIRYINYIVLSFHCFLQTC